jgi:integrase
MPTKLTDLAIKSAKPKDKPYRLFVGNGLYVEIAPTGSKYWRLKYQVGLKEKRLALGVYPQISLKDAIGRRDEYRSSIRAGRDPAADRKAAKLARNVATENTFESVARDWLETMAHRWTQRQHEKERKRLEKHAFPWIGNLPIAEIGVEEIEPMLKRLERAGHLEQAHRLRHQLSRVFRRAVATKRATYDPAAALIEILPQRQNKNYATITDPQKIGQLLHAIDGFGGTFPTLCALRLAPLLFVRPGEIRGAEWSEFDLDAAEWRIPPARRKLKRAQKESPLTTPHIVPLSTQAVAILRELHQVTGTGRFLFPGARDTKRPMSDNTVNAALRRLGYTKADMTGHGFRHMASTRLHELGWAPDIIERQLSHKDPTIRGVYNKAEHLPERRKMMQAWADYLDGLRLAAV